MEEEEEEEVSSQEEDTAEDGEVAAGEAVALEEVVEDQGEAGRGAKGNK